MEIGESVASGAIQGPGSSTSDVSDRSRDKSKAVSLKLSWHQQVIEHLPGDLAIVLEGTERGPLEVSMAQAERTTEFVQVHFTWEDPDRSTTLKAKTGNEILTLWSDQVIDGVTPPNWSAHLEQWLPAHPPFELASLEAGPGEDFVLAAKADSSSSGVGVA